MRLNLKLLALALYAVLAANAADAFPTEVSGGHGGTIEFFPYKPEKVASLDELPQSIHDKIVGHLVARLGEAYFSNLIFEGARIIDFDKLYEINPAAKDYKWEVPKYELGFKLSAPQQGIAYYGSSMSLNKDGDVIEEIGFPPVREFPVKANLLSLSEAREHLSPTKLSPSDVRLAYDEKVNSIVYEFTQRFYEKGDYIRPYRMIEMDAHDGRILKDDRGEHIN